MEYLSITIKNLDKKRIKQIKLLFSSFESEFSRMYKSQIKFEGEESKKWAYFFICELSDNSDIDVLKSITSMTSDLKKIYNSYRIDGTDTREFSKKSTP